MSNTDVRTSNFIAIVKLRGNAQRDMQIEDVSKTMVAAAFILFQRSAYRQVKMIQSHGVWVSPLKDEICIQE